MRRIRDRIKFKSLFARFFFSFVVMLVAVALTISTLLFQAFSKGSTEQINEISQNRLEQSQSMFEFMMNQGMLITLQLSLDNDIIRSINSHEAEADYFLNNAVLRKINDLLLTNKNIYSITLYNGSNRNLIGSDRDKANAEASTIEWLQGSSVKSLGRAVPRKLTVDGQGKSGKNVYTIFYYDRNSGNNEITSAIILNLTMDSFVNNQDYMSKSDNIMILDQTGHIVFTPGQKAFLDDMSQTPYMKRILASDKYGSFTNTIDGHKTMISYTYSEPLGWYFVSTIPYEAATAQISDIRHTAVITCLLLLILALCVSAILSGWLSSPLSRLVQKVLNFESGKDDRRPNRELGEMEILNQFYSNITTKYEQLEASSRSSQSSVKAEYLKELLHGIRIPEPMDIEQYNLSVDLVEGSEWYTAVMKVDRIREFTERREEVDHTITTVLYNFTDHFMRARVPCEMVRIDNEIILLFNSAESLFDSIKDAMLGLQQEVTLTYGVTVTIGIGRPTCSGQEIGDSYLTAKEAALYRLIYGEGCILVYDDIISRLNNNFEYPYSKQKVLLETVKAGREDKVKEAVEDIFSAVRHAPYHMIRFSVQHLLFSVVTAGSPANSLTTNSAVYIETLGILERMESLQTIEEWFTAYSIETIQRVRENKKHMKSNLADDIGTFLEENYGNQKLSIDMVAERFHYNGIYFGRLFKDLFNCLFLEYVTELRIRKANEYLRESKLTVKEIGEKVGFLNSSYFVTWYKKHTGLAPTEYRKRA